MIRIIDSDEGDLMYFVLYSFEVDPCLGGDSLLMLWDELTNCSQVQPLCPDTEDLGFNSDQPVDTWRYYARHNITVGYHPNMVVSIQEQVELILWSLWCKDVGLSLGELTLHKIEPRKGCHCHDTNH